MDKIRYFTNKPSAVLVPEDISLSELSATENKTYTAEAGSAWDSVVVDVAPDLESGSATANGIYRPTEGKDGFSDFTVEVPLGTKQITANGTYQAGDDSLAGYSSVTVSTPSATLTTKSITANGVYQASADNADGYSSVNVSVSSSDLPTLEVPGFNYGSSIRPVTISTSSQNGQYPKGIVCRIGDVSWQAENLSIISNTYLNPWIYDKTPIAGGFITLYAKLVGNKFNDSAENYSSVYIPTATETTGYCSVAGLGNSDISTLTYTYDANFPRSFQEVQDIYGNYFIKIPTIYRKVLAYSNGQITSYALATSALDSDYKPYPCFIDRTNSNAILPYILIGKYLISNTTVAESKYPSGVYMSATNARTLAQARGTGYQLYDWQMWELFRDLGLVISRYININQGNYIYSVMGINNQKEEAFIDGVAIGSSDDATQWYCAYDPADYYSPSTNETEATILSHNYTKLNYKCPTTNFITKLGYDPDNPFFNHPNETSGGSQTTYYCDYFTISTNKPAAMTICMGMESGYNGWFRCSGYINFTSSTFARLCYRPILNATGYTE